MGQSRAQVDSWHEVYINNEVYIYKHIYIYMYIYIHMDIHTCLTYNQE